MLIGNRGRSIAIAAMLVLTGCITPAFVADVENDEVLVQGNTFTSFAEVKAEAEKWCAQLGRRALLMNSLPAPTAITYHRFKCVEK